MRKMQRRLSSLLLVLLGLGVYRPDLIPVAQAQPYFQGVRSWVDAKLAERATHSEVASESEQEPISAGLVKGISDEILPKIKSMKVPSEISGLPEEVMVDELAASMTGELSRLPARQFERVQRAFCEPVIAEAVATLSGNLQ